MDLAIHNRLIGPCLENNATLLPAQPVLNVPALLRRILLFETYILQSVRFAEFPALVRKIGATNVVKLLDSGALKLEIDPNQIGQVGQCAPIRDGKQLLPRGSVQFALVLVQGGLYQEYVHRCIQEVHHALLGVIPGAHLRKVEESLVRNLLPRSEVPFSKSDALLDLMKELRAGSPIFKRSLMLRLRAAKGLVVPEEELDFRIIPMNETDFKLESNLERFGLTEEESHKMTEAACLGVGSLCSRIEEMKTHDALSGCVDHELALFGEKFDLLADALVSSTKREAFAGSLGELEENFGRVLTVAKLPTFDLRPPNKSFDMETFLEVRGSKEALEFRMWLRMINAATDAEIRDQIHPLQARLGAFLETTPGRVVRFVVSNLIGMWADSNVPVSGTAVSALDAFLIDKILKASGPTLFLSRKYRSLFGEAAQAPRSASASAA